MSTAADTDWLGRRAALSPRKVGLVEVATGLHLDYAAWNQSAARVAAGLASLGVTRGDRVAILAENSVEVLDTVFACAKLGGLAVMLGTRLTPAELAPMLVRAAPAVLAFGPGLEATAHALVGARARPLASLVGPEPWRGVPAAQREDPWQVVYTGGSTGTPKGAVLTHAGLLANAAGTAAAWGLGEDDVTILDAPLHHTGGLNVLTTPLVWLGGTSHLAARFDEDVSFDLLAAGAPTVLFGVPTVLARLTQHERWADADLGRLRLVITGGAPAPAALFERWRERGRTLRLGYGLSEAGPNNFWLPEAMARARPGAVGLPLPHVETRLEDGELLLRGPHLMAGYLDDAAATAATIDAAGWLHTGDLARRGDDGVFTIVGRRKEMFISGGENVYPAEVEDALCAHPRVAEAAVLGVPHERWGETGLAAVAVRAGSELEAAELRGFLAGRLARFKLPSRVVFVPSLPRTGAGKVDRRALRSLLGASE